jgi:hypothetical protein
MISWKLLFSMDLQMEVRRQTYLCAANYVEKVIIVSELHYIACAVPAIFGEPRCICLRVVMVALGN